MRHAYGRTASSPNLNLTFASSVIARSCRKRSLHFQFRMPMSRLHFVLRSVLGAANACPAWTYFRRKLFSTFFDIFRSQILATSLESIEYVFFVYVIARVSINRIFDLSADDVQMMKVFLPIVHRNPGICYCHNPCSVIW